MGQLRSLLYWMAALDPALTWDQRLARYVNESAAVGIVGTTIAAIIGYLLSYPWLWVVGLGMWVLLLSGLVTLGRWTLPNAPASAAPASENAAPQSGAATGAESRAEDEVPDQLDTDELHRRFYAQSLQKIDGATFVGERIPLDGFHYDHCTFERCIFVYRGEKPFGLSYFEVRGNDNVIEAHTPGLREFSRLLVALKYIRSEIEVQNDLQPTQDVALGFRFLKAADLSKLSEEELRQRCSDLVEELYQFLEDHALDEADRAEMAGADFQLDVARADTETMGRFRKHLKRQVIDMLAELKRRDWWNLDTLDPEERKRFERPAYPQDIQLVAERLERVGYKL